jgi:peroxiredoxin
VNLLSNRLFIGGIVNGRAIIQRSNSAPIRIWDFMASTATAQLRPAGGVPATTRLEALRIPRFRQDAQPKHVLVAANRDLLRGEIESVAGGHVRFRSGLETLRVPLDRLAAIVSPLSVTKETVATGDARLATKEQPTAKDDAKAGPLTFVMLNSGGRVGLKFEAIREGVLRGRHPIIGECRIPLSKLSSIDTHKTGGLVAARSLDAWRWELAPEPVLPETGGESSPLLGKEAAVFKLPLLGGGDFDLANEKGKVVVLDFWATWCGPCVKSLPGLIDALSAFSPEQVKLIGVNQGEGGEVVKRFLEARNLKMIVAMDGSQTVARQYGVEGIPHTVIIGPDGKVVWVKTGYSPEGAKEAAVAISKLLKKP